MLQSLNLRYDTAEDRLLLKLVVKAKDGRPTEHWLQLTRRVCAHWRQDLQMMVDMSAQAPQSIHPAAKTALSQAHHQAMVSQAPPRTEPASAPAATAEPAALVTNIVCGRRRDYGSWMVRFERRDRPGLSLFLSAQTLHALFEAVSMRVKTANWDLPALPAESAAPAMQRQDLPLH